MRSTISGFLLELYRASRRMPHAQFRAWVFAEFARVVHFDSAFWYRWAVADEASRLHAWHLYQQPESLLQEYFSQELFRDDIVYLRAIDAPPGTAVYASHDDYTSPRMRSFLKRHHQEQVLTIAYFQDIPRVAAGMPLYRNETSPAFDADDAAIIEAVAPHIVDAWRENWLAEVVRTAGSRSALAEFSLAVLIPGGMMSDAQDNFGRLMRLEWPQWQGPWLPDEVAAHVASDPAPWSGRTITLYHALQADGSRLIQVRRGHAIDQLGPKKRAVAMMFAHGASQTEIAKRLHLSSSTVNNYLGDIYLQLQVSDKVALSKLVASLEP